MKIDCYVINLNRSVDRWEDMSRRAQKDCLEFKRFPAVDALDIETETQATLHRLSTGHLPLGVGEMACFLSHRDLWRKIDTDGTPWTLVLEDDAHFVDLEKFTASDDWIPNDADIVKAETVRQTVRLSANKTAVFDSFCVRRLNSHHGGTAGYFVSREAAGKLVKLTELKCDAVDHVLFHPWIKVVQSLRVYQIDPGIVVQDYLLFGSAKKGFKSTLDFDRAKSRDKSLSQMPGSRFAKLKRELSRPAKRLYLHLSAAATNLGGVEIVKKVRFASDP
jgi:glycosyl transferase family 25